MVVHVPTTSWCQVLLTNLTWELDTKQPNTDFFRLLELKLDSYHGGCFCHVGNATMFLTHRVPTGRLQRPLKGNQYGGLYKKGRVCIFIRVHTSASLGRLRTIRIVLDYGAQRAHYKHIIIIMCFVFNDQNPNNILGPLGAIIWTVTYRTRALAVAISCTPRRMNISPIL